MADSSLTFSCPIANGLHARPAARLAEVAKEFPATVTLTNERTSVTVNAKSVLALVSADVRLDDSCRLDVTGEGAEDAREALRAFIDDTLPDIAEAPVGESSPKSKALPRSFVETGATWRAGHAVARGIGRGTVVSVARVGLPEPSEHEAAGTPDNEYALLLAAIGRVRAELEERRTATRSDTQNGILSAHMALVDDVDLRSQAEKRIRDGESAAKAIATVARAFADRLRAAESEYVRERAVDIEDIGLHMLEVLRGGAFPDANLELTEPSVLVADNLTPRQLFSAPRRMIRALILEHASTTSHAVLLARSMGIPTLVGVPNARASFMAGDEVIVDAHLGVVVKNPKPAVARYYDREAEKHRRRRARLLRRARKAAVTRDGRKLDVSINVNSAEDLDADEMKLADGIGLLRTEMVFSNREKAPTEDDQHKLYAKAVEAAGGKPVIIRMFDVGADKPVPYFSLPKEANPALGCRGVRNYARHPEIIHAQIRAIVRASAAGPVRLMAPMITSFEEVARIREQVTQAQTELRDEGVDFDEDMQIGIMVEVPLVTYALDEVCELVDFISIGTNDLAQYFAAADRCNSAVAGLCHVRHPAFLRLLISIVAKAHEHECWVGMCGDMASDVRNLPVLLGLEMDEVSVIALEVPNVKDAVGRHTATECRALLEKACSCRTGDEVERLIDELPGHGTNRVLLSAELTAVDVDCASKAEAIKYLIDRLYVTGRTDEPGRVEEAVWDREETGGTGLGHGFAIPHCKSNAVGASSVAIARLREPIEWGSVDGAPVNCVILLAMNEADQAETHMRVFSALARRLMHEDFRDGMAHATDAGALHAFVSGQLQP